MRWLTGRVFAIQLVSAPSGREIVPLVLGIDDGGKHAPFSVVMPRARRPPQEVTSVQVELPQGIKKRMDPRRNYRRLRRYHKGCRASRFLNRRPGPCHVCGRNARSGAEMCREPKGAKHMLIPRCAPWLPPTQKAGKDGILRVVRALAGFLPINTVTVEVGAFDLRALAKPDLSGAEYQQGSRYGQDSTLAALVAAYGPKCCYCGKVATAEDPLTIDHWEPRAQGGTDRWGNLVAAHRSCNEAKGARTPAQANLEPQYAPRQIHETALAAWAARTQAGKRYLAYGLVQFVLAYGETYGTYTAWQRKVLGVEKSHRTDARIIARSRYWQGEARVAVEGASLTQPGLGLTAHLRAVGGHAKHQTTIYRVRSVSEEGRVVLSAQTPDENRSGQTVVKVKKSTTAQVEITRHGAVLRTEVNRAVAVGADGKPVVIPIGRPSDEPRTRAQPAPCVSPSASGPGSSLPALSPDPTPPRNVLAHFPLHRYDPFDLATLTWTCE